MKRILSLGAGVQSSTLALMIARGELPPIDAAIFADTGWEPPKVYLWLDWLEKQLPFPVHRVQRGNLRQDALNRSKPASGRVAACQGIFPQIAALHSMHRKRQLLLKPIKPLIDLRRLPSRVRKDRGINRRQFAASNHQRKR